MIQRLRCGAPVALWVATSLVVLPVHALAGPSAEGSVLEQAQAAEAQGRHREAGDKFAAYYRGLALNVRGSESGEYIVTFAAKAYRAAWEAEHQRGALEASRLLIDAFLADVGTVSGQTLPAWTGALQTERDEVQRLLDEDEAASTPAPAPVVEPEAPQPIVGPTEGRDKPKTGVEPPPELEPAPVPTKQPSRDGVGIGLLVGGVAALGGGITMIAIGASNEGRAEDAVSNADAQGGSSIVDPAWLPAQRRQWRTLAGIGGGVAALGLAAAIWGTVRLATNKAGKKDRMVSAGAIPSRSGGALITFSSRF